MEDSKAYTGCYGRMDIWNSKEEAIKFYRDCAYMSEGSEHERYSNIILDLLDKNSNIGIDDYEFDLDTYVISDINICKGNDEFTHLVLPSDLRNNTSIMDCINMYNCVTHANSTWEEEFEKQRNINFYEKTDIKELLDYKLEDDEKATGGTSFVGETVKDFIESQKSHNQDNIINSVLELNRQLNLAGIKPIKRKDYENFINSNNKDLDR